MSRHSTNKARLAINASHVWLSVKLLIVLLAWGVLASTVWAEPTETLTIAAANSLREVLHNILPQFEAHHPHISLRIVYGPSQTLRDQIRQGAPVDVFLPSLLEEVEVLERMGLLIPGTKKVYAQTTLVVVTNAVPTTAIENLQDLQTKPIRRLAVGDPKTSSLGKVTAQFLEWMHAEHHGKFRYVYGEHSKAVLDRVTQGEAELGIVYRTDVGAHTHIRIIDTLPFESHHPIRYGAATVWTARNLSGAQAFIDFLVSGSVQTELERYGFTRRPGSNDRKGEE